MSLVGFVSDTLLEPVLSGFLGEQGGQSYAGLKQELMSRMVARIGTPGNHDIERSIRVAEFQAMIVSLKAYEDLVKVLETHEGPVDPEYNPKGFIAGANAYLSKSFRRCVSVSIESDFVVRLRDTVAGDVWLGAEGEAGRAETRAVVTRLVENEFLHASGHNVLPPSFVKLLRAGHGDCPPWVDIYRAFLCEQVKTNPRFSTILNVVMQESLSQKVEGLAEGQNVMTFTLEEIARQQQELIAVIGEALARSKEGPASAAQVADMVSEVVTGQINEIVKRLDAPFDHKIHTMFRSFEGAAQQEEAISAFHYAQARDPFVGRADRLRQIEADLLDQGLASDDPPKFRWMALCGEGGTGKSRLARELVKRNRSVWVHAGFVETSILDDLDHVYQIGQRLNGPLLMVVDYAVLARANADLPGFFKEWAAYSQREGAFPVRIIVITRRSKEFLLNELRGKGVDPLRDLSRVEEIKSSPMILEGLETPETISLMRRRMLLTAQEMKSDPVEVNDSELLSKLDSFDIRRRPLFAAMVAAEIQRGTLPDRETDPESNRLLLFYEYLDRQKRFYWLPRAKGLGEPETKHAVARHANLIRLATCSGDLGLAHLCSHVPTEVQNGLGLLPELTVADRAGAIRAPLIWTMTGEDLKDEPGAVADDMMPPSKVVPRLEPDLLGERFVLMASDANEDENTLATVEMIVRLSWSCAPDETAAFLRMAAQDFPRSMHEMGWLPPRPADKAPAVLKARARMLRNICSDIATRHGRGMISAEDLTRLFDIVDEFDDNLVELAEADAEVREHYGQVLRQVANIGARLANASTPFFDPITAVEDEGQARPERTSMALAFARGGTDGGVVGGRLDSNNSVQPLPTALTEIIVAKLPALLDRAGPFLLKSGKYEWRRPFEIAVTDVMAAAHWKHRDDLRKGGRWPTARDETSDAVLNDWWGHVETLSRGDIDDVVVMAGLVSRIAYAREEKTIDNYSVVYPAIRRVLTTSDSVELISAARICSMLSNALAFDYDPEKLTDAQREHIAEAITIFLQLGPLTVVSDSLPPQQIRRGIGNFITATDRALVLGDQIEEVRLESVVTTLVGLLAHAPAETPLPTDFLSVLANLPADLPPDLEIAVQEAVRSRLLSGAIDVDDFLSPNTDEPVFALSQLVFGVPKPRLRLPEDTAMAVLDILSEKVGSKAIRAALEAIVWTLVVSADVRAQVPIGLARRYLDRLRHEHGFDGRDHISSATLAIWGHDIVEGRLGHVQDEISSLWATTEEPVSSRGRALALWGVAVVFDATRAPNDFTANWSEWLRQADLLNMATEQQRLLAIGFSAEEAREHIHSFNVALIHACTAAARLHILDGGDPADWKGTTFMKASSAMTVERAIAKAISERIVKAGAFEQAEADLETLRAIHARTPSEALPLALAHLIDFFDDDDPKRQRMTEESQVALQQARAAEQRQTGREANRSFVVSPTAYEDVPPLAAELALDADITWHLPPAFSGDWTDLVSEAAENAVDRLRAAFPNNWGEGVVDSVRAVRRMEMSCYPGFDAVEVLFQFEDGDRQKKSQLALLGPEIAFWVTGASQGLHELNSMRREDGKPHLDISTEESAAEYVRFFCSAVHSDEGPFRIVRNFEELAVHMKTGEAFEVPDGAFSGAVMKRVEGEADETAWESKVPLLYGDAMFQGIFKVQRSGMIEMLEDEPIATDLPAIRQAMGGGLRVVRGSAI